MAVTVDRFQLVYKPVPKAACTSVKAALTVIDPGVDLPLDQLARNDQKVHAVYQTRRFRRRHWARYSHYFRFTVVRDPIKRLMSVYTNRVVAKRELFNSPRLRSLRDVMPPDPDPDFFFQNLVPYMAASSSIKHHALHTHHFTGRDLSLYSKVYRTNDIKHLADDLSEAADRKVTIPRFNSSEGAKLDFDDLKPKTRDAILSYAEPEFEHLGALFPRPM